MAPTATRWPTCARRCRRWWPPKISWRPRWAEPCRKTALCCPPTDSCKARHRLCLTLWPPSCRPTWAHCWPKRPPPWTGSATRSATSRRLPPARAPRPSCKPVASSPTQAWWPPPTRRASSPLHRPASGSANPRSAPSHDASIPFPTPTQGETMPKAHYDSHQLDDLVLQMMETELGGEQVYRTALTCAVNPDLKKEWESYLEETLTHQDVVRSLCDTTSWWVKVS